MNIQILIININYDKLEQLVTLYNTRDTCYANTQSLNQRFYRSLALGPKQKQDRGPAWLGVIFIANLSSARLVGI